ncbi:MAG TPA: TonB family protein [Polyangia bacterium]|jgi:TonB family protein|nr:TonB family protein [Polyangia bacterium]
MNMPLRACAFALAASCFIVLPSASAHEPGENEEASPVRTAPVLVERVPPVYPEAARQAGIGGTVSLEITVAADGHVTQIKVLRGVGYGLDEAAVAAAERFKFRPATDHGRPVASLVTFDQSFVIRPHFTAEVEATPASPTPATPPGPSAPAPPSALPAPSASTGRAASPAAPAPSPHSAQYETTVQARGPTTAASSETIRNLDFDLRPKTSPNDLLRVVPGLLAVQHQGGGKADQLFLRGFDADHGTDVGIFFDGVPINLPSHAHGQGFADLHWLIPEAVERIDVVKGPYDVRYGDFSTAGAVNLVSRRDFAESSAQYTLNSFPTRSGRGAAGHRFVGIVSPHFGDSGWAAKLHPWVAFEAASDDGPFIHPQRLRRFNFFGKLSYDLTPSTSLGAFIEAYGSTWTASGQIPSREVDAGRLDRYDSLDPSEGGVTQRQMVIAFLRHKAPAHEVDAQVYYTRYRLALFNDFTFFNFDPLLADGIEQDDARSYLGARLGYHFHKSWRGISFRTTFGAAFRHDDAHVDLWSYTSQNGEFRKRLGRKGDAASAFGNNDDIHQSNLSGWAEEDVVWNRYARTVLGVRIDYFGFNVDDKDEQLGAGQPNTSGVAQRTLLSPKLSQIFRPTRWLDIYVNFGVGFHSNDARIAVREGRTTAAGSVVNTVPRLYGGELGLRFTLGDRLAAAAALWASYLENETVFVGDEGVFEPSDPSRRLGVDFELRLRLHRLLFFDYDLSQAASRSVVSHGNGGGVALAPRLYMTGGLTFQHPVGVRAGLRFRYLGARPAFSTSDPIYIDLNARDPQRVNTAPFFVVDLYAAYRWRFLEASLGIQNLLNSDFREAQFGNTSCTRDETFNPANQNYAVCGASLPPDQRTGVPDVHFTPGVPINLQFTVKAYF